MGFRSINGGALNTLVSGFNLYNLPERTKNYLVVKKSISVSRMGFSAKTFRDQDKLRKLFFEV